MFRCIELFLLLLQPLPLLIFQSSSSLPAFADFRRRFWRTSIVFDSAFFGSPTIRLIAFTVHVATIATMVCFRFVFVGRHRRFCLRLSSWLASSHRSAVVIIAIVVAAAFTVYCVDKISDHMESEIFVWMPFSLCPSPSSTVLGEQLRISGSGGVFVSAITAITSSTLLPQLSVASRSVGPAPSLRSND